MILTNEVDILDGEHRYTLRIPAIDLISIDLSESERAFLNQIGHGGAPISDILFGLATIARKIEEAKK